MREPIETTKETIVLTFYSCATPEGLQGHHPFGLCHRCQPHRRGEAAPGQPRQSLCRGQLGQQRAALRGWLWQEGTLGVTWQELRPWGIRWGYHVLDFHGFPWISIFMCNKDYGVELWTFTA